MNREISDEASVLWLNKNNILSWMILLLNVEIKVNAWYYEEGFRS